MKKNKYAGWYYFASMEGFDGIQYLPEGPGGSENAFDSYGPFLTFAEAKKGAIEFFRTDLEIAKERIKAVKMARKTKVGKRWVVRV